MLKVAVGFAVLQTVAALHKVVELDSDKPWQFIGKYTYARTSGEKGEVPETLFKWDFSSHLGDDLELRGYVDNDGSWDVAQPHLEGSDGDEDTMRAACIMTGKPGPEGGPLRYRPSPRKVGQVHVPGSTRTHSWYFYLAKKSCTGRVQQGHIVVDMTNPGGFFTKEFSADRNWILECLIAVVATLVVFAAAYAYRAWKTPPFHPVMKHYYSTLWLQILASVLIMSDYLQYASNGEWVTALEGTGFAVDMIANLMFLLLILVFAMGFKVVEVAPLRRYESLQKRKKTLAIFFVALTVVHALLLVAQLNMKAWDMAYPYTTPPGIILACLRLPTFLYYIYSLKNTLDLVAAHHTRFLTYGFVFAAHILLLPVLLVLALLVDPWVRFKTVFMCDILMRAVLILVMGQLLWPGERSIAMLSSGYEAIPLVNADEDKIGGVTLDNLDDEKSEDDGL